MKPLLIFLAAFITLFSTRAFGQSANNSGLPINQGIDLLHHKKFTDAIAKFNEVLKLDPENQKANYQMGYTLFVSGREKDAIPYFEKLLARKYSAGGVYDMLGTIYDNDKQPEKAIGYFLQGIKVDSAYQRLHFNLAVTYYKMGKYNEAEKYAIQAMKLDIKHVNSLRVYAMSVYGLKKRGCALLAWCSFLLIEPQSKRSTQALGYIKNILHSGTVKAGGKDTGVAVSMDNPANLKMANTIQASTIGKTNLSPVDSLQLQLTSLFKMAHTITGDKEDPFVSKYFADYFEKLGNTGNMPVFTRLISINAYKENYKWLKDNDKELTALDNWMAATKREF